jgi:hypothetical protein
MSGQLNPLEALIPGKELPWYRLDRRLDSAQSRSVLYGEEPNLLTIEPRAVQPVASPYIG